LKLKLKVKNALPFEDGYFKSIIHPDLVNQLRGSSAFIDLHKYTETGAATFAKGTLREGTERGLVGVCEGFKFYESTEAPMCLASAGDSEICATRWGGGRFYFTFFFGKNSYGVTDFDGGIRTFIKTPGPQSTDNPLDLYSRVGYRIITTAKVLNNSACLWLLSGKPAQVG
jgi:N4-gp56 family major capsid protein